MNKHSETENLKSGRNVAFMVAFIISLLALLKGSVGYYFNSAVLMADAFHSSADILAVFASGFGLWIASREKSRKFPHGLFKAETLASLTVGIIIFLVGIKLFIEGYHKLFYLPPVQHFPLLPVSATIISIFAAFFIAVKVRKAGKAIASSALLANANESLLDVSTSVVVLIGILLAYVRVPFVEGAVIIAISLLILKLGVENAWTSLLVLMDADLDPKLQSEITEKINEVYGVKGVSEVMIRQAGPFKIVECKIQTSPDIPLYRAHELADKVEAFIRGNYNHIESVFIHVEPSQGKYISAIIPVNDLNGLNSKVHGHFGRAPYFVILKLGRGNVEVEDFYINEHLGEKIHIGVKVIKAIIKYKVDVLFTSQIGEISFHMLKDNYVDIYRVEEGLAVNEVINRYQAGMLEKLAEPTHPAEESRSE